MMARLRFLGAAGTVTGSGYVLEHDDGSQLLIDLGMFQGSEELESLNKRPLALVGSELCGAVVTHAHLDHCGRLPLLKKLGFKQWIYATEATKELLRLTLYDAAKIAREESEEEALYTEDDVDEVLERVRIADYNEAFILGPFQITLRDAGHILGSASVEVQYRETGKGLRKALFSGDLGNTPEPLVKPTYFIKEGQVVVMESTYGSRTHANEDPMHILQEEVNTVERTGGTLLIPSFSLERTQEILHCFDHLKKEARIKDATPVFLDSPMAIEATSIYKSYPHLYSSELAAHAKEDDPFDFPGLSLVDRAKSSERIREIQGAKVIIAGSGMMNGGRILGHALYYLADPLTRLLFVGYQGEETLGREILDGAKEVTILNRKVPIAASIRKSSGLSAHADQPKLVDWLSKINGVERVILTHGEDPSRQVLAEKIKESKPGLAIEMPYLDTQLTV